MTQLPRAMTTPELGYIRMDGQYSKLYLAIHKPAQVYTALVNQTFTAYDEITQIAYDSGAGTLGNVLPGMTLWVSAVGYGQCELGQCRIRIAPDATYFYLGENSDIPWADDLFLTVMDEFGIWQRNLSIDVNNVAYMDLNIAYTDQHVNCNPVPILGPRLVPAWLIGSTVTVSFDGSLSYVIGSAVSSHAWSFPGSSASTGLTTATPTATYNAVGTYRFSDTQTAANGKATTAYGYVMVFDRATNLPVNQFDLTSQITGNRTSGGWSFSVRMYSQADFPSVVDRAMVCLFARDFYGTNEVSIGPITGRENIVAIGWINGESIVEDPDGSYIDFTVDGVGLWLKRLTQFPIGIDNTSSAPAAWTDWQGLTVDESLYHLFYWQSTVIPTVDVFLTNDTRYSAEQYAPGGTSLYDQLTYLLTNTILGDACSDRFNRMFCEIDEQLTPPANRSTFPVVLTLQKNDWREQLPITRIPTSVTSQVNLSGIAINLPNTPLAFFSLAPGHDPLRWGAFKSMTKVLLTDQPTSNQLTAMQLAWDNHQLEFAPDLGGNNRMVDIVPHQFVSISVSSSDTPRGFTYSGHIIVREVSMSYDKSSSDDDDFLQISWKGECETFPGNSSNGDPPVSGVTPIKPPTLPILPLPPIITPIGPPTTIVMMIPNSGVYYSINGGVNWLAANAGLNPTDYASASNTNLMVNTISGEGWLAVMTSSTGSLLYYTPLIGSPWSLLYAESNLAPLLAGGLSGNPCSIRAFGINPGAAGEAMFVGRLEGAGNYFCPCSPSGATRGIATPFGNDYGQQMVYGNNQWTTIVGASGAASINWCNRNGSAYGFNATGFNLSGVSIVPRTVRGGKDGSIFYGLNCWKTNSNVNLIVSPNNGASFSDIGAASFITPGIGASPDGTVLFAADQAGTQAYQSVDGGTTWAHLPPSLNFGVFCCYGTNLMWVMQGQSVVQCTLDGGVTFLDITGDLLSYIPSSPAWYANYIIGW